MSLFVYFFSTSFKLIESIIANQSVTLFNLYIVWLVCHKNSASLAKPGQKVVHPKCMALFVPYGLQNSKHFMITMGLERDFMPNHSLLSAAFFVLLYAYFFRVLHSYQRKYIHLSICM